MQNTMSMERLMQARGQDVYSSDGDKLGAVEEIYLDQETQRPEWVGLGTGMFGTKRVLVPVVGFEEQADGFTVPYTKDQVKNTPDIDSDEISQETEAQLYSHYGLEYSESRSDTGLPEGGAPSGSSVDETDVVRSEEELQVGKQDVEAGRVRLRKYVDTEPVAMDVDLHRETARVTSEPIDQPVSDAQIGEDAVEVELHEEQPIVAKQTVAKERVGLEKDIQTERRTVEDEVRKERVEVEDESR